MSTVSVLSVVEDIDLLLEDYKNIHDAPKEVTDAKTDIIYLRNTVTFLETLFSDPNHLHVIQLPALQHIQSLNNINIPLSKDLKELHTVLQKWPIPPTALATATFATMHNRAVENVRKKITEYQLRYAVFLSKATSLPEPLEEEEFKLPESVDAENEVEKEHIEFVGSDSLPAESEGKWNEKWRKLNHLLKELLPTLRLSHLVEKLEEVCEVTDKVENVLLEGFRKDVTAILELARMLDQRLLGENHFAQDVQQEIHTIVDLEIKLLLHELRVLPSLSLPHQRTKLPRQHQPYESLPVHPLLRDHQIIFIMILVFVAGVRGTHGDPRHEEGATVRDEVYDDAAAGILERLAVHSGVVNSWCELRRSVGR